MRRKKEKHTEELDKEEIKSKDVQEGNDASQEENQTEETSELEKKDQEIKVLNDKYLRLYSEFDNFRKRTIKEKADIIKGASGDVIKDLLSVLDDFDRAIQANEKVEDPALLKEGFNLIHDKLSKVLELKGLKGMESQGQPFDTEWHEAITEIPAPSNDLKGKVVDVVEKGYVLNDNILRYAKVVVGK